MSVIIPSFQPRPYQLPLLKAMSEGCKRAVCVWHRRAGKEIVCFNWMIRQAFYHRVGTYCYFFPTTSLGRRILWDGRNKDGKKFLDYIPEEIIDGQPNKQEMKIKLINGSIIQIIGTDSIINVGINPIGCVFSEFSLQDPATWNFVRPILRENEGWAIFNMTPRGRNHAYDLYLMAKNNPDWFCQLLTVDDTGILTKDDIAEEINSGMSEQLVQQEFYCNFDLGVEGSYYAKLLNRMMLDGRITSVPHDLHARVYTAWDLGISDETCIVFYQCIGQEIHIINIYRNQGEGLAHYARILQKIADKEGYVYGGHAAPHDIKVRELGTGGLSRLEVARSLGIDFDIVPNIGIPNGIEMVRGIFPRLWIDEKKCAFLIKALENYHKQYNEKLNVYSDRPKHDWSSHMADSVRMMAIMVNQRAGNSMTEQQAIDLENQYAIKL